VVVKALVARRDMEEDSRMVLVSESLMVLLLMMMMFRLRLDVK